MMLNSISTQSVATSVWGNATRTLTNPSGVFSDATRTLTSIANTLTGVQNIGSVVTNGTRLDLRPGAGKFRFLSFFAPAAAASQWQDYDGTTGVSLYGVNLTEYDMHVGNPTVGLAYNNGSGGSVTVTYSGFDIG